MNSYSTSGNYYQEVICDPVDVNTVYFMDSYMHRTIDGGKTVNSWGEKNKHVDNHFLWINPSNTKHHRIGTDGGMYESWDGGENWAYKANLPITQFYKVAVDNTKPFYYIYGGTQDNNSMGGPSWNTSANGVANSDWFITNGGDGFESAVDPENPNIVYAQTQYGYLVRYDKNTGEKVGIRPQPMEGEKAFRWNWDAPLIISPHNNKRLYFAANKLFRSDDRGNTWERVSGDLTSQLDRNKMKVMGRVWDMDAVMKNMSTTIYGNIVALDESSLQENLIYVGTDDGLIQVSEDAKTWRKISQFKGVPELTYVNSVFASKHDINTVYASFNNHKRGDFKPYILKSTNKGKSWKNISSDLPERGSVYDVVEDHINPNLLFAGTEFGIFVSINGGENWLQIKSGIPTIAVRDIEIQEDEDDLVLATFGRGFYILDNYSILRDLADNGKPKTSKLFKTKKGLIFGERRPLGRSGKSTQGESYFSSENPKQGVHFSYYLADDYKSLKSKRTEAEKKLLDEEKDISYPDFDQIRKEGWEEKPSLVIQIFDTNNNEIKRIIKPYSKGLQTLDWDGRIASLKVASKNSNTKNGPWVIPGKYFVSISKIHNGEVSLMIDKSEFEIESLYNQSLEINREETFAFQQKVNKLYKKLRGTNVFF
ncbi:MAG: glycosyl hydrolase, partial [Flavobacteriales bacterium]|nr:glycosyl hydrolase [Flavobacteriales bacterium]